MIKAGGISQSPSSCCPYELEMTLDQHWQRGDKPVLRGGEKEIL